jgi:transketolase
MRNAFADEILKIALEDPRVVVLSGDIGNRLFDKFKASMPDRFVNCGVAEANMISLAAGLASAGMRPVCYTITPFVTTRCLEQIKVDVCYHEVPVAIVGTGSGLSYASLGATHHSFEDLACLRVLPGMQVLAPADAHELRSALRWIFTQPQPVYMRIGKKGEPLVTDPTTPFTPGRWQHLREGTTAALLASGTILPEAIAASQKLATEGIEVDLWNCSCVKPLDERALASLPNGPVITAEEHSVLGGFGSAVAEFLCDHLPGRRVCRLGIPDAFLHDCGEQEHARAHCGLDADSITRTVRALLGS